VTGDRGASRGHRRRRRRCHCCRRGRGRRRRCRRERGHGIQREPGRRPGDVGDSVEKCGRAGVAAARERGSEAEAAAAASAAAAAAAETSATSTASGTTARGRKRTQLGRRVRGRRACAAKCRRWGRERRCGSRYVRWRACERAAAQDWRAERRGPRSREGKTCVRLERAMVRVTGRRNVGRRRVEDGHWRVGAALEVENLRRRWQRWAELRLVDRGAHRKSNKSLGNGA
jgi:hypothetical protein